MVRGILRVLGLREIMHGVDLLSHRHAGPGVKARLGGDMLDSALLGVAALKSDRPAGVLKLFALVAPLVIADLIFAPRTERG